MSDVLEQLRFCKSFMVDGTPLDKSFFDALPGATDNAIAEIERLQSIVDFVDSWVSNPVGSYSTDALDGLFAMTRDRINSKPQI